MDRKDKWECIRFAFVKGEICLRKGSPIKKKKKKENRKKKV